ILTLSVLGLVRARRGDPEASELVDEAWELAEPTNELQRMGPVALARAEVFWLEGDHRSVLRATETTYALATELGAGWLVGELASWRRRAGADEVVPPNAAGPYALELAGDWRAAADAWTRLGCPYDAALALADADEPEPLREALDRLQSLG